MADATLLYLSDHDRQLLQHLVEASQFPSPPSRDQLAAMAMQGILASAPHWCDAEALRAGYPPKEIVAVNAYEIADAMLAERARGGGNG